MSKAFVLQKYKRLSCQLKFACPGEPSTGNNILERSRFRLKSLLAGITLISVFYCDALVAATVFDMGNISQVTKAKLEPLMITRPRGFGEPVCQRAFWDDVRKKFSEEELNERAKQLEERYKRFAPDFSDAAWRRQRSPYSKSLKEATYLINGFLALECIYNDKRYNEKIAGLIDTLCALKTWTGYFHDREELIFTGKSYFYDIGASDVAVSLAQADYTLGSQLPSETRKKLRDAVRKFIFEPYLKCIDTETPVAGMGWIKCSHNWNAVCNSALIITSGILMESPEERAKYYAHAIKSTRNYIAYFMDDGYCVEGVGYYCYGFSHYLLAAKMIQLQTSGQVNLTDGSEKIANIIRQMPRLDMSYNNFPAFGDSRDYEKYPHSLATMAYAVSGIPNYYSASFQKNGKLPLWNGVRLAQMAEFVNSKRKTTECPYSYGWRFPHAGVVVSRAAPEDKSAFSLALKAGNNSGNHNHNDIGSFAVAMDGKTMIGDPGYPVYTWDIFGRNRYNHDACNSFGHPVPLVDGKKQGWLWAWLKEGKKYFGTIKKAEITPERTLVVIDLKTAYPEDSGLKTLTRSFTHSRSARTITITDEFEFDHPRDFSDALLTFGTISKVADNRFLFDLEGRKITLDVTCDDSPLKYQEIKLKSAFEKKKSPPTRLGIYLVDKVKKGCVKMEMRPVTSANITPAPETDA